jgi:hypothetical protein
MVGSRFSLWPTITSAESRDTNWRTPTVTFRSGYWKVLRYAITSLPAQSGFFSPRRAFIGRPQTPRGTQNACGGRRRADTKAMAGVPLGRVALAILLYPFLYVGVLAVVGRSLPSEQEGPIEVVLLAIGLIVLGFALE